MRRPHLVRPGACRVLVPCLAALGITLSAGGAQAASLWHVDRTGDVVVQGPFPDNYGVHDATQADIVGIGASYDATALRVGTSLREYQSLSGFWEAKIRTSQGFDYRLEVGLSGDAPPRLRRSSKATPGFFTSACAGLTVTRTTRGITARLPATCLGSAWRVRVGVRTAGAKDYPTVAYGYTDDAFAVGRSSNPVPVKTATLGPWLDQH